ncbi:MAG: hypothetical protein M1828_007230 [Chrysothrix sp. TS-e1954]|nr:MAG: hypothetical protein M1828_007230 [Chrysothrix sp. TS-e1954]
MPTKAKARAVLLQDFGYDNFSSDDEAPTPRLVIANVGNEHYSQRAFMHAHSPLQETFDSVSQDVPKRPNTAGSTASRDRKLSMFSRPLTSYECEARKRDSRPGTASGVPRRDFGPSGTSGIGVALGSPTGAEVDDATLDGAVLKPLYTTRNDSAKTLQHLPPAPHQEIQEQRPKPKRWKSVGNLFSRKKSLTSKTPPAATPELQSAHFESLADLSQQSEKADKKSRSRSGSRSSISLRRSKPKAEDLPPMPAMPVLPPPSRAAPGRPGLAHAQTAPAIVENPMKPELGSKSLRRKQLPQQHREQEQVQAAEQINITARKRDSRPQLDVEIPQTRFERFSVMFSDLQGLNDTTKAQARTSLLARRNRSSKLVPLATLAQEAPELGTQDDKTVIEPTRPQTAPAPEAKPSESVADVPIMSPTPRRAASTKSINKGPAYSLFPKTKTPRPSVSIPQIDAMPSNSFQRSSIANGYIVSPPPKSPPPALPFPPRIAVSTEIDDMLDFLESASSEAGSPPKKYAHPNPLKSHSTPSFHPAAFPQDDVSSLASLPDLPILKPLVYQGPHSNTSTPRQRRSSPALRSSGVHQQTLVLPPSPTSSSSAASSPTTGTAPSTAGTAPSDHEAFQMPQISSSTSPYQQPEQAQERPRATSLRRGGRDVAIVGSHAYVLNPPLAHSPASSRTVTPSAVDAATASPPSTAVSPPTVLGPSASPSASAPKRTSLVPNTNPFRRSPNPASNNPFQHNTTLSNLSALTTQPIVANRPNAEASLSATSPAPSSAQTLSPAYGYDAEHSPLVAVAQTMKVVLGNAKPQTPPASSLADHPDHGSHHHQHHHATKRHPPSKAPTSKIPLPKLPTGNPIRVLHSAYNPKTSTYLDEDSDIDPPISPTSSDFSLSAASSVSEEDHEVGRKSTEGIVRARTPTVVEVDGRGMGVIGLGLSGAGGCAGAGVGLGRESANLKRGRSVEGLLEVA